MKNKPKTYYYGIFRGKPHVSIYNYGFGDVGKAVILFLKKNDAESIYAKVGEAELAE